MLKRAILVMGAMLVGSLAVVPGAEAQPVPESGLFQTNNRTAYTIPVTGSADARCFVLDEPTRPLAFPGLTPSIGLQTWNCPSTVANQKARSMVINQAAPESIQAPSTLSACFVTLKAGASKVGGGTLKAIAKKAIADNACASILKRSVKVRASTKSEHAETTPPSTNGAAQLDWSEYRLLDRSSNLYGEVSVRHLNAITTPRLVVEYWYLPGTYAPPTPANGVSYAVDFRQAAINSEIPPDLLPNGRMVMVIFTQK